MRGRILLVVADGELAESLSDLLAAESLEVEVAMDGDTGFVRAAAGDLDLIILGTTLPQRSGFSVCAELRKTGVDTSILMLSSKTLAEERVTGLRLGADDCVPRSCDPNELIARVEALLRRVPKASRAPLRSLRFGDVRIDFALADVSKGGHAVSLSGKELGLLRYLAAHRERVVSRKELLLNVWEYDASISSRTIDVHVGWLRQKLEDDPQRPRHIKTIRGRGYRFDWDNPTGIGIDGATSATRSAETSIMTVKWTWCPSPKNGIYVMRVVSRQIILVALAAAALSAQSLREQADRLGMLVGGAVDPESFGQADYANAFATQLNMLEPENDMKFAVIHPAPGVYNFSPGDQIVAFARQNGQQVRGHNLVWYNQISPWVTSGNYTPAQLNAILQDHIATVVSHYSGQVFAWDVVNEAMSDSPPALRSDIWYDSPGIGFKGQGTKYIEQAFLWARAADPNALLFYNDYSADVVNAKSNAIYAMAGDFKSRGVPLDGIGLQMHLNLTSDLTQLGANIQRFTALGLQVHITEMDVSIPVHPDGTPIDPNALQKQATIYQTALSTCLRYKGCTAFQTWGLTDKYSWIPGFSNGADGLALPLDANYQPKPAYYAMAGAFEDAAVLTAPSSGGISAISATAGTVLLAPDGLASLFGTGLAGTTAVQVTDGAGASRMAPLLYVSDSQINCLIPADTLPGPATITLSGGSPLTASFSAQTVAPGLFSANANGQGIAAAIAVQGQTSVPVFQCGVAAGSCVPVPISLDTGAPVYLELFGTGIRGRSSLDKVHVNVGDVAAPALYAGPQPQFPGLDQVNVLLPASLSGSGGVGIQLEIDGRVSNVVQIAIQ